MEDNNTSAFNCRGIPGSSRRLVAARVRPGGRRQPAAEPVGAPGRVAPSQHRRGALSGSRSHRSGLLHDGDAAVRVFTDRGWTWGRALAEPKDYQHFRAAGAGVSVHRSPRTGGVLRTNTHARRAR